MTCNLQSKRMQASLLSSDNCASLHQALPGRIQPGAVLHQYRQCKPVPACPAHSSPCKNQGPHKNMAGRCCRGLPPQRVEHLASGVAAGLQGLYGGFAAGLVGIVRTPMQSYSSGHSVLSGDLLQRAAGTATLCDLDGCQLLHRLSLVVPQNRQDRLEACAAHTADQVITQQALKKALHRCWPAGIGQGLLGAVGLPLSGALDLLGAVSTGLAASAGVGQQPSPVRDARQSGEAPTQSPAIESLLHARQAICLRCTLGAQWTVMLTGGYLSHAGGTSYLSLSGLCQTLSLDPLSSTALARNPLSSPPSGVSHSPAHSSAPVLAYCPAEHAALHLQPGGRPAEAQDHAPVLAAAAPVLALLRGSLIVFQNGGLDVVAVLDLHGEGALHAAPDR